MPEQDSPYRDPHQNDLTRGGVTVAECATEEDASFLADLLQERGISSAVLLPDRRLDLRGPQVKVAPENEVQARSVLAEPIPAGKREAYDSQPDVEPFALPACPTCGSEEIILDGVDEGNSWQCERCHHRWIEAFTDNG